MDIILFGIGASFLTEIISWVNNKLSNTTLKGMGAQLTIFAISLIGALIKILVAGNLDFDFKTIGELFSQIYATSQVYFLAIGQWYAVKSNQSVK